MEDGNHDNRCTSPRLSTDGEVSAGNNKELLNLNNFGFEAIIKLEIIK